MTVPAADDFPAWPGLQQQRREAGRKEREAAELEATRFAPALARAVKAAGKTIADPSSSTFRTLERRRQAVCVAMGQRYGSLPADGDGAYTEQRELDAARRRVEQL
ncbi:hypothetical protein [Streptomyces aureocirculatus]|uniref:hypothetical protein n=1 Tax=Streptomyces aureocirculatus TaxID=67275 RepID=UPI0004CAA3A9|nr:hypothetical protein [Streptomyces aureocirculatus]